jgi:clan AA aspartic protease
MGLVYENITLKNGGDVINVQRGIIGKDQVREKIVMSVVDTGSEMLVINEALQRELGLEVQAEQSVRMANNVSAVCKVTEPVQIQWNDRSTFTQAVVLDGATEVLLGAICLEGMNLMVDPGNQKLIGVHGEKIVFRV